jgi:glucokinase
MILAGDVGGTKTILGLFLKREGSLKCVREDTFRSRDYPSMVAMIEQFLCQGREKVDRLAMGVAGPVVNGRSQIVNLRWPVDERDLAKKLALKRAHVLNDLEATAWGIPELSPKQLVSLTPGLRKGSGNAALIAAGTGLGMAMLVRDGDGFLPQASEGGHQDFCPRNDLEMGLLRYMLKRFDRVSVERIVAGPGFTEIYRYLIDSGKAKESKRMRDRLARLTRPTNEEDSNQVISQAGVNGEDRTAERTVELLVSLYGGVAGNLALVTKATGGLFVGGGIAPQILPKLRSGEFVRAFRDKGRLSPLMDKIPVKVILEPRTALLGAAAYAARPPR